MDIKIKSINKQEVLKYLGYRGSDLPEDINNTIDQSIDEIIEIAHGKYIYKEFEIIRTGNEIYLKDSNFKLVGKDIKEMLKDCQKCILLAATLGLSIDKHIRMLNIKSFEKGIISDCCASSGIESICNEIETIIKEKYQFLTDRFSPGYGDMPIEVQGEFLSLLDAGKKIGLTVSDSGIMIPRKSVTAIIGIANKQQKRRFSGCENCKMFMNCQFRKAGKICKSSLV